MHLANNLAGLMFVGMFLTPIVANGRLLLCYLLSGLGGSIVSAVSHPTIVSVGASGSILGLWGIFLTIAVLQNIRTVAAIKTFVFIAGLFVLPTFLLGAIMPGIDNAAHIGGLLTGVVLGVVIYWFNRSRKTQSSIEIKSRKPSLHQRCGDGFHG
jgi:rhomboid protease GluP